MYLQKCKTKFRLSDNVKDKLNLISIYNTLGIQFIAGLVRQIEMHINRQTHLETDRQTDRQTNRQTYRQTDMHTV